MVSSTASSVSSASIVPTTSSTTITLISPSNSSIFPTSSKQPISRTTPPSSTSPSSSSTLTWNSTATSSTTPSSNLTATLSTPPSSNSTTTSSLITSDVSITTTTTSPNTATSSIPSTTFDSSSVAPNASSNISTPRASITTPSASSVSDSTSTPSTSVTNIPSASKITKSKTSGNSSPLATKTNIKPVSVSGSSLSTSLKTTKKQQAQTRVSPTSSRLSIQTSTTNGNKIQCPDPKLPASGYITSDGPYLPNMAVTYTCLSGYALSGPAQIFCTIASTWSEDPPTCLPASMDTHIDLGNAGQVPVWLAIILGLTCGVLCLLLFTCVILYCLRVCGCRKEPIFSIGGLVSPGPIGDRGDKIRTDTNTNTRLSVVNLDQHQIQDTFQYKEPPKSNFETSQPPYGHRDQPHTRTYEVGQPVYSHQVQTTNAETGYAKRYQKQKFSRQYEMEMAHLDRRRQPAKKPSEKWMPHAQNRRDINTSTN